MPVLVILLTPYIIGADCGALGYDVARHNAAGLALCILAAVIVLVTFTVTVLREVRA